MVLFLALKGDSAPKVAAADEKRTGDMVREVTSIYSNNRFARDGRLGYHSNVCSYGSCFSL